MYWEETDLLWLIDVGLLDMTESYLVIKIKQHKARGVFAVCGSC